MRKSYRSDLTDDQWEVIKTLIPQAKTGGRPRTTDMRGVINGIFYILVAGCPKAIVLNVKSNLS